MAGLVRSWGLDISRSRPIADRNISGKRFAALSSNLLVDEILGELNLALALLILALKVEQGASRKQTAGVSAGLDSILEELLVPAAGEVTVETETYNCQ